MKQKYKPVQNFPKNLDSLSDAGPTVKKFTSHTETPRMRKAVKYKGRKG